MPGPLTLAQLVARLGGRIAGSPDVLIRQVGTLSAARSDEISFLSNQHYRSQLETTRAGAVILVEADEALTSIPRILCEEPYFYFASVSRLLNPDETPVSGVDPSARIADDAEIDPTARIDAFTTIDSGAKIGATAWIGAGCRIGKGVHIGAQTRLYSNVVINEGCRIGARGILHSGVVIGADGFGIAKRPADGHWIKIPQIGRVLIENDVEVGANTTIDRGALGDTVIGAGVKLDNQIQIGHNVRVGAHTAMAGCVAVAGSAEIGARCSIGAAAVILGHLRIADDTWIGAATIVSRTIYKPGRYTGVYPIAEHADWLRNAAWIRRLASIADRLKTLEQRFFNGGKRGG